MLCSKIIDVLNKIAPESFALEWDNVGLLVGDKNNEINKIIILICNAPTLRLEI